jgi:hypothetical protein
MTGGMIKRCSKTEGGMTRLVNNISECNDAFGTRKRGGGRGEGGCYCRRLRGGGIEI